MRKRGTEGNGTERKRAREVEKIGRRMNNVGEEQNGD